MLMAPTNLQESMARLHKTNARLREIIKAEDLTRPEVAQITQTTKSAVDQWLRPPELENYREMHDRYLRLLEFELGLRAPGYTRYHRGRK